MILGLQATTDDVGQNPIFVLQNGISEYFTASLCKGTYILNECSRHVLEASARLHDAYVHFERSRVGRLEIVSRDVHRVLIV